MRILTSTVFEYEKSVEEFMIYNQYHLDYKSIILSENQKNLLNSGLFYTHGRDKCLRPITFFNPDVVVKINAELEDAIVVSHFVNQYIINYLMVTEKVENWVCVLDLSNLSFTALPKAWIIQFIKVFSHNYYGRAKKSYMLNTSLGCRMMWNIVKIFIDKVSISKLTVEGTNTNEELVNNVHPTQLQEKYGGQAPDVSIFWPPYSPSDEYGVDQEKLTPLERTEESKRLEYDEQFLNIRKMNEKRKPRLTVKPLNVEKLV